MQKLLFLFLLILLLKSNTAFTQVHFKDSSISVPLISVTYALQRPGGDLAHRFGISSELGAHFHFKNKNNWITGAGANFIFGNNVHEPGLMVNITNSDGYIIGSDGRFADVRISERAYSLSLDFGKIIPRLSSNPNSGFLIMGSAGVLWHKIKIDDFNNTVPSLSEEYIIGYDRLTSGFSLTELIGYFYLSNNRLLNFFGGIEFIQAWAENRRAVNFDTMKHDNTKRNDYLTSIKIGWILPLYKRATNKFYYN